MRKIGALLVIVAIAILILVLITNPQFLNKIWLYLLGFIGYILVLAENGYKRVIQAFQSDTPSERTPVNPGIKIPEPSHTPDSKINQLEEKIQLLEAKLQLNAGMGGNKLGKCTLTVLRYLDDGQTTLGLLFLRNRFFAYTLEDTHREEKIKTQTRIPEGIYRIAYSQVAPEKSAITRNYQARYPWFKSHIQLLNVPNFEGIYIHVGNTHEDTAGCLLIADGVTAGTQKALQYSRNAFERFYKYVSALLDNQEEVSIQILDEDWFDLCEVNK